MKSSKSINSLANEHNGNPMQQFAQNPSISRCQQVAEPTVTSSTNSGAPTSPICRCRVMYLGSSVPHITKDGLQGIQEPLRELYPDNATLASGNAGIDSWLSVWSNGILIENVDETGREVKRFFKIDALHYCAAVKYVPQAANNQYATMASGSCLTNNLPKFLPLDSPHARQQNNSSPPIFASILRRTTGVKVLECHAFVCKREAAANALVRCCFHAYADTMYAKQIGADVDGLVNDINNNSNSNNNNNNNKHSTFSQKVIEEPIQPMARKSKSIAALNKSDKGDVWQANGQNGQALAESMHYQSRSQVDGSSSVSRRKSLKENCDKKYSLFSNKSQAESNMQKQHKLSKSLHHLNQPNPQVNYTDYSPQSNPSSTSHYNLQDPRLFSPDVPFYNPYASRVPSYPPQQLLENGNRSGTLRSIKSVAAHSIASTLLRSKTHAKEMAMLNQEKIISFHQPNGAMQANSFISPPIPPMFLHDMPNGMMANGSQTMKLPSNKQTFDGAPMHFEAMTPKEMKKLLKKSAKYSNKFGENGLPILPVQPIPPLPMQMPMTMPPPALRLPPHLVDKNGTLGSQSIFSMDMQGADMPDMAGGLPMHYNPSGLPPMGDPCQPVAPMKSILVKPNPEFLKSKAGKKWLKQQKEFKKLLPPHLDGLPIIFGPPPLDALEPAQPQDNCTSPAFLHPPQPGLPMMNSSNFSGTQSIYGPSGRASTASTLLRYSPNSQIQENYHMMGGPPLPMDYPPRSVYNKNMMCPQPPRMPPRMSLGEDPGMAYINPIANSTINERQLYNESQSNRTRNHMVEQSVISLGDENDCDEDGDDGQTNGYYNSVDNNARSKSNGKHHRDSYHERETSDHQDYEQVMPPNDDQSSYSSGIYRRGHMNERAFSYSIRQEHKSSNGVSIESTNGSATDHYTSPYTYQQQPQQQHMELRADRSDYQQGTPRHHENQRQHSDAVNEITARIDQLNTKSFKSSKSKPIRPQ